MSGVLTTIIQDILTFKQAFKDKDFFNNGHLRLIFI